jgi:hypothetical protein
VTLALADLPGQVLVHQLEHLIVLHEFVGLGEADPPDLGQLTDLL